MALFSTNRASNQSTSSHLVEFRAGKMVLREKMVHPDKRKGMVYIHQSDDMLMHFCWKDRSNGNVEDDLIIFPDDVEFVPVKECKTGRVFLLKFKNSNRKIFFWMQEPKTEKDEEYCEKVNSLLNNPPAPGSARGTGGGGGGASDSIQNQLSALGFGEGGMNALGGMDENQMMQFLNMVGGGGAGLDAGAGGIDPSLLGLGSSRPESAESGTRPSTAATAPISTTPRTSNTARAGTGPGRPDLTNAPGRPQIQLSDLQSILSGMNVPGQGQEGQSSGPAIDMEDVLTGDRVSAVLGDEINEARLLPHLPEDAPVQQNRAELNATIRSPQFRQAAGMIGMALQTGQLGPVLGQFGVPDNAVAAASKGDIQSFAELLESAESGSETPAPKGGTGEAGGSSAQESTKSDGDGNKTAGKEPPSKKGKEDQDEMDLD